MTTAKSKVRSARESVAGGEGRTGGLKTLRSGRKRLISRRSLFEDASVLLVFESLALLENIKVHELLWDWDEESRKITKFSRAL